MTELRIDNFDGVLCTLDDFAGLDFGLLELDGQYALGMPAGIYEGIPYRGYAFTPWFESMATLDSFCEEHAENMTLSAIYMRQHETLPDDNPWTPGGPTNAR